MERDDEKEAAPVTSPDGKYTAYIKNQNVYVKELATGKEKQLSLDGTLSNYYSVYIRWSPDSTKSGILQNPPSRETLCVLCRVFSGRSAPTETAQAGGCANLMGMEVRVPRPPLCEMSEANAKKLAEVMKNYGILA